MKRTLVFITTIIIVISIINKPSSEVIIPKNSIRFRVIASSNSKNDQNIKIKVRDNIQKQISLMLKDSKDITTSRNILNNNIPNINRTVDNTLKSNNNKDSFKVNYGQNYFPEKIYKGVTYEEGYYESLVVTLGNGEGNNWWCVLFPPLCILEAEETKETSKVEYKFFAKEIIDKYF